MAKKQRASEGESTPLAPEVSPPPVANPKFDFDTFKMPTDEASLAAFVPRGYERSAETPEKLPADKLLSGPTCEACGTTATDFATLAKKAIAEARDDYEQVPAISGHGMTRAFTEKGWVAYRCATNGQIDVLTPKRADGSLQGESKPSAAARMMAAIQDEYR